MSSAPPVSRRHFRSRLARTMLFILLLLSMGPLLLMGSMTYLRARSLLRDQAFALLGEVARAQGQRLSAEISTGQLLLARLLAPNTRLAEEIIAAALLEGPADPAFTPTRQALLNNLQSVNQPRPFFNQFILLRQDGRVLYSSRLEWEGIILHPVQTQMENFPTRAAPPTGPTLDALDRPTSWAAYIDELGLPIPQAPGASSANGSSAFVFITAVPVLDKTGQKVATVLGIAESPVLQDLIKKTTFYATNHYLIAKDGRFIGLNPYPNSYDKLTFLQPGSQHSTLLLNALRSQPAAVTELTSFENRPAITAYTWLPDLGLAWVAEIEQATVYSQINALLIFAAIIFCATLALMALIIWQVTARLTRPIIALARTVQLFADGNWEQRAPVERQDEVGLLAHSFNHMADELTGLYHSLEAKVEERTFGIRTMAEVSQTVIAATSLDDLLHRTLELIVKRLISLTARHTPSYAPGIYAPGVYAHGIYAAIFLIDQPGNAVPGAKPEAGGPPRPELPHAVLHQVVGPPEIEHTFPGLKVRVDSQSLIGWVATFNRSRVDQIVTAEGRSPTRRPDLLPETRSEVAIPIAVGDRVLGVLNIQSNQAVPGPAVPAAAVPGSAVPDPAVPAAAPPFTPEVVSELQTLANQIAAAVQNFRLLETTQVNLQETDRLYQASHLIAQAETSAEIFATATQALAQLPYTSAILIPKPGGMHLYSPQLKSPGSESPPEDIAPGWLPGPVENLEAALIALSSPSTHPSDSSPDSRSGSLPPLLLKNFERQAARRTAPETAAHPVLLEWMRQLALKLECEDAAFLPVIRSQRLAAMLVLAAPPKPAARAQPGEPSTFTPSGLQPYTNLIELIATTLQKVDAIHTMRASLAELQTLTTVGQTIALETDLDNLYQVIHAQVEEVMGRVNFYIALYDPNTRMINVPYMVDTSTRQNIQPFPLGQGLTSILIQTRQPLMMVEDTEAKTRALGAITAGKPAKSWLGVPLLIGGEIIGAMVVQDIVHEHRFTPDHQRLLTTIAAQVAVVVRNARLLESVRRQAEREKLLYEITSNIRRSVTLPAILQTTAKELAEALGARRAQIEINLAPTPTPLSASPAPAQPATPAPPAGHASPQEAK